MNSRSRRPTKATLSVGLLARAAARGRSALVARTARAADDNLRTRVEWPRHGRRSGLRRACRCHSATAHAGQPVAIRDVGSKRLSGIRLCLKPVVQPLPPLALVDVSILHALGDDPFAQPYPGRPHPAANHPVQGLELHDAFKDERPKHLAGEVHEHRSVAQRGIAPNQFRIRIVRQVHDQTDRALDVLRLDGADDLHGRAVAPLSGRPTNLHETEPDADDDRDRRDEVRERVHVHRRSEYGSDRSWRKRMSLRRRPRRRAPQTSWVASANGVGLAGDNRPTRYAASPTSSAGERPASRSSPSAVAPSALLSFVPSGRRTREWWAKAGGTGRPSSAPSRIWVGVDSTRSSPRTTRSMPWRRSSTTTHSP